MLMTITIDIGVLWKFIVLAVILVGLGLFFVLRPSDKTKKAVKKYIESLSGQLYSIIVADLEYRVFDSDDICSVDYEQFKKEMIQEIYNDSWDFVHKAVIDAKLDPLARLAFNKKTVENLIDVILSRKEMKDLFKDAYAQLTNEVYKKMMEEEKRAREEAEYAERQPLDNGGKASKDTVSLFDEPEATEEQLKEIYEEVDDIDHSQIVMEDESNDVG